MTTARTIVTRALSELMYFAEGETPSAAAVADGLTALNSLMASWHTEGILWNFPPGTTWKKDWAVNITYSVNDSVARSGNTYTCTTAHLSSLNDKPGVSPDWADYWTLYAETPLTISSTFPLDAAYERGVVSMLAVELAPQFGKDPSPFTLRKASDGKTQIIAAFMPINPVSVDAGLTRMPSQIWPYNIDQITG